MNGISVCIDQAEKDGENTQVHKMDLLQNQSTVWKTRQLCESTLSVLTLSRFTFFFFETLIENMFKIIVVCDVYAFTHFLWTCIC